MNPLKTQFPVFFKNVKAIYPTDKTTYHHYNVPITTLFRQALEVDPEIDEPSIIPSLVERIAGWLEYPVLVDYFTDEERSDFEKTIQDEEYIPLREYLDRNKLRLNPLRYMNALFDMYESIIQTDQLRSNWKQLHRIAVRPTGSEKCIYEKEYEIEQRKHYISNVEQVVREICVEYIKSKLS